MKKLIFILTFIVSTSSQAFNSWDGYKLIKNTLAGKCYETYFSPLQFMPGIMHSTCDVSNTAQQWSFENGVFRDRKNGLYIKVNNNTSNTSIYKERQLLVVSVNNEPSTYGWGVTPLEINSSGKIYNPSLNKFIQYFYNGSSYLSYGDTQKDYYNISHPEYGDHTFINVPGSIDSYLKPGNPVAINGFNSSVQSITSVTGLLNGTWIGAETPATFDCYGVGLETFCNAYLFASNYTKSVGFKVSDNNAIVLNARYRLGSYERYATDYTYVDVATSATQAGYGLHAIQFGFGAKLIDIATKLPYQSDLASNLNTPSFLKSLFTQANSASLSLYDGYWTGDINPANNISEVLSGSALFVKTQASYSVSFKNLFTLRNGVDYAFSYNSKGTWDVSRMLGSQYIPTSGVDIQDVSPLGIPLLTHVVLNGAFVGNDYRASIKNRGNGNFDAYIYDGQQYTKVVTLNISGGLIKVIAAKYRVGQYIDNASDYIQMPIATSPNSVGYGVHYVVITYPGN